MSEVTPSRPVRNHAPVKLPPPPDDESLRPSEDVRSSTDEGSGTEATEVPGDVSGVARQSRTDSTHAAPATTIPHTIDTPPGEDGRLPSDDGSEIEGKEPISGTSDVVKPPRVVRNHAPVKLPTRPADAPPPPSDDDVGKGKDNSSPKDTTDTPRPDGKPIVERRFKTVAMVIVFAILLYTAIRLVFLAHDVFSFSCVWFRVIIWLLLAILTGILAWISWIVWRLYRDLPPSFQQAAPENGDEENRLYLEQHYVNEEGLTAPDGSEAFLEKLRDRERYNGDGGGWMTDFRNFQVKQDDAAREIAKSAAIRIAAATATSRWAAVDMAVTIYLSTKMIADIAKLYNRRISNRQLFRLTLEWATGVAVSGQVGAGAGRLGDAVGAKTSDLLANSLKDSVAGPGQVGAGAGDAVDAVVEKTDNWIPSVLEECFAKDKIAGTVGHWLGIGIGFAFGKLAEGAANAFFALRLGNRAIRYFRALRID